MSKKKKPCSLSINTANSKLKVWTITEGQSNEVMEINKVGALWKHFEINIVSPQEYQVRPRF